MENLMLVILVFAFLEVAGQSSYKVVAYYTGNGETIKKYPVEKLTHIICSFLKLQNDKLAFSNDGQRKTMQQLVALKKQFPHLKIMVSIGGWGGCARCSALFASAEHRNNFAKSAVSFFKQYHFDGLDLDLEYTVIQGNAGHSWDKGVYNKYQMHI